MNVREEPSYLAFARANVRKSLTSSATIVRELVARIDRDASALKAAQPRTISTVEELDSLPLGSIIMMTNIKAPFLHTDIGWESTRTPGKPVYDYVRAAVYLPATVLYEPTP